MHTPTASTSRYGRIVDSGAITCAAGMANIAAPTPNQPICVSAISAEGR